MQRRSSGPAPRCRNRRAALNPDPESGTRLRACLAAALLTLPAAAADLADAITTAAAALQPPAGDALAVPVCTLTLAGRAMPLL